MKKKFKRDIDSLDNVFNFISQFITHNKINKNLGYKINLVIEELFTNMVKYNVSNQNEVMLDLSIDNKMLKIILIDYDVAPFDINQSIEYDTKKPLEERTPGKIGIHFVKEMMDKIKYDYKNGESKITLLKDLRN